MAELIDKDNVDVVLGGLTELELNKYFLKSLTRHRDYLDKALSMIVTMDERVSILEKILRDSPQEGE